MLRINVPLPRAGKFENDNNAQRLINNKKIRSEGGNNNMGGELHHHETLASQINQNKEQNQIVT